MAQNTLKQKAREFAKTHGVSYLTALKAVDEPLHDLRDLVARPKSNIYNLPLLRPHFRLVGSQGPYSAAYEIPHMLNPYTDTQSKRPFYAQFIRDNSLSSITTQKDAYRELGRRVETLERSGAKDIWSHRELHRAGLAERDMSPALHYFDGTPAGPNRLILEERNYGIFGVALSSYLDTRLPYALIPVTVEQLDGLMEGKKIPPVAYPPVADNYPEAVDRWAGRYALYAMHSSSRNSASELHIFFKEMPADLTEAFVALGMDAADFIMDDQIEDLVFEHSIRGAQRSLLQGQRRLYSGKVDGVLEV